MKYSKVSKWLMPLLAVTMAGCSGSGSTSTNPSNGDGNTGNLAKLSLVAPSSLPAGIAASVPIILTNNDSTTINNLNYAIDNSSNTTGATITFESASAASCRIIAPKASCTLMADIAATPASHPGSFNIATSQGAVSSASKAVTASSVLLVDVNIGLVQSASNTSSGADGLSLYYPNTVVGNADGCTQVIVTAVVTSANAGSFNTIQLVDGNGNLLNYTTLSGNSGNGMTNLALGSVVTLLVTVPSGSSQLQFKAQTANNGSVVSTAANSNTVIVTDPTATVGIINILPNYFNLTTSYESQIITVANSGNGPISSLSFTPSSPLTELSNNCAATLAAGASCQYVIKFNKNLPQAGTSGITVNYNNGSSAQSATATVNYTGIDPVAGLTISGGNNSNFDFTTRTSTPTQSALVTLTNTGNSNESSFNFNSTSVPDFTTNTTGITNACTQATVLAPTESCSVNLVYTNSTATPTTTAVVPVSYTFGQKGLTATSNIHITYQTIQSTAILAITPSPASFTGIVNNGVDSSSQTINIANSGDDTATAITPAISGTNLALFSVDSTASIANPCGSSILAGESCNLSVKFGPASSSITAGSQSANLDVAYTPYSSAATPNTTSAALSGQVSTAQSAIIAQGTATANGFAGGNGESSGSAYQVEQAPAGSRSTPSTLTYTITNTGSVPATSFYIDGTASQGWSYTGCGTQQAPATLTANGGSCTLVFTLNKANVGAANLDLSTLTMHWVDQDSPDGQAQAMSGTVYTNVYVAPSIAIMTNPSSNISIAPGESFTMSASLSGGYDVAAQTIRAGTNTGAISFVNNNCALNSQNSYTCTISAVAASDALAASSLTITLRNSTTPSMAPVPNLVTFAIAKPYFPFSGPVGITLNSAGTIAFIANYNDSTITLCSVNGSTLSNCADSGATGLSRPRGITLNSAGTIAFIANYNDSTIIQCSVSGGVLSNCTDSGASNISHPAGITLNSAGTIAFISNQGGINTITQCSVSGGNLSNCADSGARGLSNPVGMTLNSAGIIAFIASYNNDSIIQCSVSGGILSNCADSGASGLSNPAGIVLNSAGTIAFIVNQRNSTITRCSVNGGSLSNCADSGASSLSNPVGITLNSAGTFAFITNYGNNAIIQCSVSGGTLSNCARTGTR
mgnify:CR=1 FL=1